MNTCRALPLPILSRCVGVLYRVLDRRLSVLERVFEAAELLVYSRCGREQNRMWAKRASTSQQADGVRGWDGSGRGELGLDRARSHTELEPRGLVKGV